VGLDSWLGAKESTVGVAVGLEDDATDAVGTAVGLFFRLFLFESLSLESLTSESCSEPWLGAKESTVDVTVELEDDENTVGAVVGSFTGSFLSVSLSESLSSEFFLFFSPLLSIKELPSPPFLPPSSSCLPSSMTASC